MTVYLVEWKNKWESKYNYSFILDTEKMTDEGREFFEKNITKRDDEDEKDLDLEDFEIQEWFEEQIKDATISPPANIEDSVTIWGNL